MKKRFSIIALATVFIIALGAGQAFAAAYDITTNFGIRVTEQGTSEQVGSITIGPKELGVDVFDGTLVPPQEIIVELLGGATISRGFAASYDYDGTVVESVVPFNPNTFDPAVDFALPYDYFVVAVNGQDFIRIVINTTSVGGQKVLLGHDRPSRLCFNLLGTIYNSTDPAQQLVQVSYRDNYSNTFSGDIYVATVKPKTTTVDICNKIPPELVLGFAPGQGTGDCGVGSDGTVCILLEDTATGAFIVNEVYSITLGRTDGAKVGVGIGNVSINYWANPSDYGVNPPTVINIPVTPGERLNRAGSQIFAADYTSPQALWADTAQLTFTTIAQGTGVYELRFQAGYDTCTATPGFWTVDMSGFRIPCGGSFSFPNLTIAEFVTSDASTAIFPYAAASAGGWFNGLVITNPNPQALAVQFLITEADGDVYTGSATVQGNQMAVGFAEDVMNPTTEGPDAAFGDESYTFTATAPFDFYGFLFIGDGTMAQGYLAINPQR